MIWLVLMGVGIAAVAEGALSFNCDNIIISEQIIKCQGEGFAGVPGTIASIGLIVIGLLMFFGGILNVGAPRRHR